MGFNGVPAVFPQKTRVAFVAGELAMDLLKKGITFRKS